MFQSHDSTPEENGQWPLSTYPPSTFLARPAGKMKDDAINASAFLSPDSLLRLPIKHAQHPVMAGKVGEIPRDGSIRLPQRIGAVDQCDIVEFGTADALGLQDSKQAGIMQIALGLRRQTPKLFRS